MKKNTISTIALAAAVLLLSGSLAVAADAADVSQNADRSTRSKSVSTDTQRGEIVDLDRADPLDGGRRLVLHKPRNPFIEPDKGRVTGMICLNFPVANVPVCWKP